MKSFLKEFKEFALKGNVMDMAIGVIIGGAFGAIITSLCDSFINPLINSIGGADIGGAIRLPWVDYSGLDAETAKTLTLNYGDFLSAVINFLIIALVLFIMLKAMNKLMSLRKKEEEAEAEEEPEPTKEEVLLTEIRDLLKDKNKLSK